MMPSLRRGLSVRVLRRRRSRVMCFGSPMPIVKSSYVKPEAILPSLTVNPVQRVAPEYKEVMVGGKPRSLLMPMEM